MTLFNRIKHKYALSDFGAKGMIKAIIAVTAANLVLMCSVGLLYRLVGTLLDGTFSAAQIPFFAAGSIIVLLLVAVSQAVQYNTTFLTTYIESGIRRRSLAEKLRKLSLSFFGKKDLTDLTNTIMNDCAKLETASSHWIPELLGAIISTTIVVLSLFFFNWKMTLAAVWVLPVAFLLVLSSKKWAGKIQDTHMTLTLAATDAVQEGLETLRDLKSYNATETFMDGFVKKVRKAEKHSVFMELFTAAFVCSAQMILKLGIGTTCVVGTALIINGEISTLTFFMYLLVVSRMYDPLQIALQNLAAVIGTEVQYKRMDEILHHAEQTGEAKLTNSGYDIAFEDVHFGYSKENELLRGITFTAKQGEVTALIGASGSGKTTLARLAARFYDIHGGTVKVGGMDISKIDPETLLTMYSIVFQDVTLFNNTVLENIRIGKKDASDEEVKKAAELANCVEFIEKLPQKWNTVIGENGSELSGGERQRISIARAFLKDAPVILLDEATASLDVDNETVIQSALSRLIQNKTVLVIAHRMRTVENADHVVVLKDGKVHESGTPAELLQQQGPFSHMVQTQKQAQEWKM